MNSNPNFAGATTIRGVLLECARSEPAGRLVVRFFQSASFLLLVFAVMYCLMWGVADYQAFCNKPITVAVPEPSKREIAKAHRKHGTFWSWQDGEECYFVDKQGRTCKLFGSNK